MGVLVAGGTGALGSAVVRELLDAGYECTLTWIVDAERERAEAELGDRAKFVRADLIDPQGGADEAVAAVDDLEAVVNLVGGFFSGPAAHETAWEDFDRMMRLNLSPAINLACAAMPRMLERGAGSFVAVSARPALRPFPGSAAYSTAKAAVLAFYGENDARVNATIPVADSTLRIAGATFEKGIMPGAGHGFLRQQDGQNGANAAATRAAWPRTISWFRQYLGA